MKRLNNYQGLKLQKCSKKIAQRVWKTVSTSMSLGRKYIQNERMTGRNESYYPSRASDQIIGTNFVISASSASVCIRTTILILLNISISSLVVLGIPTALIYDLIVFVLSYIVHHIVPLWNDILLDIRETEALSSIKGRPFNYFFNKFIANFDISRISCCLRMFLV